MKIKAVLFDLDGTLLDTAPDFIRCVNSLRERHRLPVLPEASIREQVSNGARALTRLAFALADEDPLLEMRRQELLALYAEILGERSVLFPGMGETLRQLETAGLPWGIVTNKPSTYTTPLLARIQLPFTPATVVCPDHVSRPKPDPEALLLACTQIGCLPDEAIYLGDHLRDIEAGLAAGMRTAACRWGYISNSDDPADWQSHHLLNTPGELCSLIDFYYETVS